MVRLTMCPGPIRGSPEVSGAPGSNELALRRSVLCCSVSSLLSVISVIVFGVKDGFETENVKN